MGLVVDGTLSYLVRPGPVVVLRMECGASSDKGVHICGYQAPVTRSQYLLSSFPRWYLPNSQLPANSLCSRP